LIDFGVEIRYSMALAFALRGSYSRLIGPRGWGGVTVAYLRKKCRDEDDDNVGGLAVYWVVGVADSERTSG
jgi:hypothetical protein